jgi:hypothetical protein
VLVAATLSACGGHGGAPSPSSPSGGTAAGGAPDAAPGPSADACRAAVVHLWRLRGREAPGPAALDELTRDCQDHAAAADVDCVLNAPDAGALSACGGLRGP